MEPIPFKEANDTLGGGRPDVSDLPIARANMPNGTPIIISKWQLTNPEIAEIVRTGQLYIMVVSNITHHPIAPMAFNPFEGNKDGKGTETKG